MVGEERSDVTGDAQSDSDRVRAIDTHLRVIVRELARQAARELFRETSEVTADPGDKELP